MSASDSNVVNPKEFNFEPATKDINGNPIVPDDYTIFFAQSDVNNTAPAFTLSSLSATVPTKDLVPGDDGKIHVPVTDLALSTQLASGVWAAMGETDLGKEVSAASNIAFFNIVPPAVIPAAPGDFGAA